MMLEAFYVKQYQLCRVPTLLLTKNPGLFQDPMRNFSGPFRSPRMLKYKEKKALPCPPSPSLSLEVGPFKSS